MHIGNRLREEREKLGFNQTDFAAIGGVGRKSQFNYEDGERQPDAAYLAAIAAVGADVLYILTGVRSGAAPVLAPEQQQAGFSVEVLSRDEQCLVENFRACPPEEKQHIADASALLAKPKRKRA